MIGQTISHYKILEKLGEGGMGVVYKALDTKLDREVALKFLPERVSSSEQDRARFLQEAKAASALNHPNVCSIHAIGEYEGQSFIDMELVVGQTLRSRVEKESLKLNDAITYAIQIGEALHEAHTLGIVHRDIKCENIMVNSKNQIKVMDFGLAKLRGSVKLTKSSSTTGTLAYMAPEQIQGQEIDARADIFSFGVVLYEMLTGQTPFRGEHEAAIMYSILNEEPLPIQRFRDDISSELLHILNRALEKDPEDRYQNVKDMTIDLRRLKKESSRVSRSSLSHAHAPMTASTGSLPAASPQKDRRKMWFGIGAAALLAAMVLMGKLFFQTSAKVSDNLVFKPLQVPFSTIWYPGLSADGNWVAFPATDANNNTEIYYMHVSGSEPKALTNDSVFKYTADISPDGSQVLFGKGRSREVGFGTLDLWSVSTLGGKEKKLADFANPGRWSPDGQSIAYIGGRSDVPELWVMDADGSGKRMIFADSTGGTGGRVSLSWSPDGASIAWIRNFSGEGGLYQEIILHELKTGKERQLTFDKKNIDEVCWTGTGLVLFSSNRGGASNLWAIPDKGGDPVQVTRGPGPDLGIQASANGQRILYLQQSQFGSIHIGDLKGLEARAITPDDQSVRSPKFSPDGKQIAFIVDDQDPIKPNTHLFVVNTNGEDRRQLLTMGTIITNPRWSPDGSRLAYSYRDTSWHVAIINVNDPSEPRQLTEGICIGWIDDGNLNVIKDQTTSWRISVDAGNGEVLFEDSTIAVPSPDGSGLVILDNRGASAGLWVKKDGNPKRVTADLTSNGQWFPDSKSIVSFSRNGTWRYFVDSGKQERYPWENSQVLRLSDFSPDGKKTVFVKTRSNSKLILIDNFQ